VEIVYVVDDPQIALKVEQELRDRAELHALDIQLVILERNGGYALANNFGVSEARGETIVLMNSDVVPEGPGWLAPLKARLAAMPPSSVVGAKLLHADGGLQHAGMYFHRLPDGYWQNMHYHKGYGREFPPANVERDVPAVTGALMVLSRADYLAVGGFDARYVIGDYEDSDLCLKLRARGGRCRYVPEVALLHCERQSIPGAETGPAPSTLYNEALHTQRWSSAIGMLMAEFGGASHDA
jgi:GT2 family glycosyltransferase